MRILAGAVASTFLLSLADTVIAQEEAESASLEYRFNEATVEPPDQRALDRIRRRPSNLQCVLVEFSVAKLVELINRVDAGNISVSRTSISFAPFRRDSTKFNGFYSSTNAEDGRLGPYEWAGHMADQPYFKAVFIISADLRLTGKIDTPQGVYSLSQSHWSDNQFLCEIDPAVLPVKID